MRSSTLIRARPLQGAVRRPAVGALRCSGVAAAVRGGTETRSHETDYVVIGSGIGGLLAKYGYRVTVVESHYLPGGAAHSFEVQGYKFDAGPSFHMGIAPQEARSANPLKQVLDLLGERVECARYSQWVLYTPEGDVFPVVADRAEYVGAIHKHAGEQAASQFRALEAAMAPLQRGAALFPAAALRSDPGLLLTAARFFGPELLSLGLVANQLTGPFSSLVDRHVTDRWLKSLLDLECFVLSGMTARDTLCAEMAFMFAERGAGRGRIDYPMGGSEAIVSALVRGVEKYGGRVLLRSHVDEVLVEGGRAVGVRLRQRGGSAPVGGAAGSGGGDLDIRSSAPGSASISDSGSSSSSSGGGGDGDGGSKADVIRARMGVVSNASCWDTVRLLPPGAVPAAWRAQREATPQTGSFVHLHLGIDADGLPADLDCHHLFVSQWNDLEAPQNVRIASIPTVFDASLAPPGKAVVHAYTAGNEPFSLWEGTQRGTPEYAALKEERSQCLWQALERVIPDIRARAEVCMVGTPLTHARFLRRHRGTYGPAISAKGGTWPGPATPLPGLSVCGDSCMPGIGVPAAAASGMIAANALAPVWSHLRALDELKL